MTFAARVKFAQPLGGPLAPPANLAAPKPSAPAGLTLDQAHAGMQTIRGMTLGGSGPPAPTPQSPPAPPTNYLGALAAGNVQIPNHGQNVVTPGTFGGNTVQATQQRIAQTPPTAPQVPVDGLTPLQPRITTPATPTRPAPRPAPVLGGGSPLPSHAPTDPVGTAIVNTIKPAITPIQLQAGSTSRPDMTMDWRPPEQRPVVNTPPLTVSPLEMGLTAAGFTPPGIASRVLSAPTQLARGAAQITPRMLGRGVSSRAMDVTEDVVRQNVPAAVLRDRPVYVNVRQTPNGRWDAAGFGRQPTQTRWTGEGHNTPVTEVVPPGQVGAFQRSAGRVFGGPNPVLGYSRGADAAMGDVGHIAVLAGRGAEPTLRHEGYHGMVDLLRGGTPRSAVEGARWYHALPARMGDSRHSVVRGLGNMAEEVGARVFGEGGVSGAVGGLLHAVHPTGGVYYNQTFAHSPAVARATRAISFGVPTVLGGSAAVDATRQHLLPANGR